MKRKVNVNRLAIFVICCWTLGITSARADLLRNSLTRSVGINTDAFRSSGTLHGAGTGTINSTATTTSTGAVRLRRTTAHGFTFVPEPPARLPLLGALLALAAFVMIRRRRLFVSRQ